MRKMKISRARLTPVVLASAIIITIIIVTAVFADYIAPHSPYETSLSQRLTPPFWQEGGSLAYPLGTDLVGRDILSRLIYGARASIIVAVATILLAGTIGLVIGLISGYSGGLVDAVLMRIADAVLTFPLILLAILLVIVLGPSFINVIIAIAFMLWARYARVVRGEVISLKERDFVTLAKIAGCSTTRILSRHLFPNVQNTLMVLMTLQVGWVIVVEATLSFLGAGVPPPAPAWGSMVAEGRNYLTQAWWVTGMPGLAIILTVLSFNMIGDWIRDILDPRLRQV